MSLRRRLTALLLGSIGLPVLVGAVALATLVPAWLRSQFDEALLTRARALASLSQQDEPGVIDLEFDEERMPEFEDPEEPYYFEVWIVAHPAWTDSAHPARLVERSQSFFPSRDERRPSLARSAQPSDEERLSDVTLPDGRRGRQVQLDFVPEAFEDETDEEDDDADSDAYEEEEDDDEPEISPVAAAAERSHVVLSVLAAGGTEAIEQQVALLRGATAAGAAVLLAALAAIVHVALRHGLKPIDRVVDQVASMDAESLGQRLDTSSAPSELQPLIAQLNAFIDRLGRSFRRERQLTADMAHELKTPIAELRSLSEVGERWPDDRETVVRFFEDARTVAQQMERVVVHLLALARHDAGQQPVVLEEVSLPELIAAAWRPFARTAEGRELSLELDIESKIVASTDPELLALVLSNLFSNVVAHADPGTTVTCTARRENGRALVRVANEASSLEASDLDLMFDRFWRKDPARSAAASAGLGLSIVRAFAQALQLDIGVTLEGTRLRVDLRLPVHARPEPVLEDALHARGTVALD